MEEVTGMSRYLPLALIVVVATAIALFVAGFPVGPS
jgi:hypothetical protein